VPRELKSLQRVIDESKKLGLSKEEIVELVAKIRVEWSWGRSDSQTAEKATRETKWEN
jgi:hypothetical protein